MEYHHFLSRLRGFSAVLGCIISIPTKYKAIVKYILYIVLSTAILYLRASHANDCYEYNDDLAKQLSDLLIDVAEQVGTVIYRDVEANQYTVEPCKSDRSILTTVDTKANSVLIALLNQGFKREKISALPIVTEESTTPLAERKGYSLYILADPLDGSSYLQDLTQNTSDQQIKNNISVFISIMENQHECGAIPVFGVIHCPFITDENNNRGITIYGGTKTLPYVKLPDKNKYRINKVTQLRSVNEIEHCPAQLLVQTNTLGKQGHFRPAKFWETKGIMSFDDNGNSILSSYKHTNLFERIKIDPSITAEVQINRYLSLLHLKKPGEKLKTDQIIQSNHDGIKQASPVLSAVIQRESPKEQQDKNNDDLYATEEFDLAAFYAIYTACGGSILDHNADQLRFNQKQHFKLSDYLLIPKEAAHDSIKDWLTPNWSEIKYQSEPEIANEA
ncbi:MAG: hypothetical protein PUP46_03740 [Endozoicomonas sp. (ex Botrylloides leachii)]|nr:hypothetical protein [Endozoicomonas sp. (ex Botrylloides leachii)]